MNVFLPKKRKNSFDKKLCSLKNVKSNKELQKFIRELELRDALACYGISLRNYGLPYEYIETGKPCINKVIKHEIKNHKERSKRRKQLKKILKSMNIPYREDYTPFKRYINHSMTLEDVFKKLEKQQSLSVRNFIS